MEALSIMFALVYVVVMIMLLGAMEAALYGYLVVSYILEGKALSAIARRRGIEKPWLAWVPVGKFWLLGAISDQYRYVVHGQVRNRRKLLLWLGVALEAAALVLLTVVGFWAVGSIMSAAVSGEEAFLTTYFGGFLLIYLFMLAFMGVTALVSVFQYMACYDVFRSCDPDKSLVYLLVSIFANYPQPFFLYSCRDKDLGMPPRQDVPIDH